MAPPFTNPAIEPSPKRVRVLFGGQFVVDTKESKLVWEHPYYPVYFFPASALRDTFIRLSEPQPTNPIPNTETYDLIVGDRISKCAVTKYFGDIQGSNGNIDVKGLIKIKMADADAWFEEDEEIFVHPKDPYKRVEVLLSSRHVRVELNGVELADTCKPRLLFEPLLPVRTYIPLTDCRLELFEKSALETQCPYKGIANYYSIRLPSTTSLEKDLIWYYRTPLLAVAEIRGYVAFYDEKVDVWVDGVKQERPMGRE